MKTRRIQTLPLFLGVVIALILSTAAPDASAMAQVIPFSDARMYFEMNSTDEDLGIQFKLDGEPWTRIIIFTPNRRKLVDIEVKNSTQEVGLTEWFNESAEPPLEERPLAEWLALFPEGDYGFFGLTVEGDYLVGVATFTHDIPDGPEITSPVNGSSVDPEDPLVVTWNPVADPNPPESVIVAYEVIVEKDEEDERLRVFKVDMLPTDTSVTVPPEFLEADKDYKVEILAIETSHNQTITEIAFETDD